MSAGLSAFAMAGSLALSATMPAPVSASAPTGEGRVAEVYSIAGCIVQSNRGAAAQLMMSLPPGGEPAHASALRTAAEAGCGAQMLLPEQSMQLRGGLAQALFLNDFERFGVEPRNPRGMIDLGLPAEGDETFDPARNLYRWSDCVVRNDTANIERLFRTPAGSRQESQVLQAMQPYLAACAGRIGDIVVAESELRSLFAQSAYQALYRYWSGQLRGATAASYAEADQIVCRVHPETASRARNNRVCMPRSEWIRLEISVREGLYDYLRRATAGAGR